MQMNTPGYETLADVLERAYQQAASGKGKERHAGEGVPFERQPMSTINIEQGSIDGFLYQARKKALEAKRLPPGRAQAELLGAINYLAGAVIALDSWAESTLPGGATQAPYVGPDRRTDASTAVVCCGKYATCQKPCTPRGEFLAGGK